MQSAQSDNEELERNRTHAKLLKNRWEAALEFDSKLSKNQYRYQKGMWRRFIREEMGKKDIPVAVLREAATVFIQYIDYLSIPNWCPDQIEGSQIDS